MKTVFTQEEILAQVKKGSLVASMERCLAKEKAAHEALMGELTQATIALVEAEATDSLRLPTFRVNYTKLKGLCVSSRKALIESEAKLRQTIAHKMPFAKLELEQYERKCSATCVHEVYTSLCPDCSPLA